MNRIQFVKDNYAFLVAAMKVALGNALRDSVGYTVVINSGGILSVKKTKETVRRDVTVCSYDPNDFDLDYAISEDSETAVSRMLLYLDPADRRKVMEWRADMRKVNPHVSWKILDYIKKFHQDAYRAVKNEMIEEIANDHFRKGDFEREISEFVSTR